LWERLAQTLDFERLLCLFVAAIPWMPFLNLGSSPVNASYAFAILLWSMLLARRGRNLSIPLTPGLLLGCGVFAWFVVGAAATGSIASALVDLLHFANYLLAYALLLASVRTEKLVGRMLRAMLLSSYAVAAFGIALSFLVNVLDMQFLPRFMVDALGGLLYGARGQEMLIGYGTDMGNWYRDGIFRTVSIFFNPMQNSEYTMFFLFLSVSQILGKSTLLSRRALMTGSVLLGIQLFVSFSRTAYFGAIAGGAGFFLLLLILGVVPRRQVIRLGIFAGIAVVLLSPLAGAYVYKTVASIGDMHQFSNAGRLIAMAAGVLVWMHFPWFGTGYGNEHDMAFGNLDLSHPNFIESLVLPHFRDALLFAKASIFGEIFNQTNYHSGHILLLAQLGLFGALFYWIWNATWVHSAWRLATTGRSPFLVSLGLGFVGGWGTFFATCAIDSNTFYPKYGLNIFLVAALCEIAVRLPREPRNT